MNYIDLFFNLIIGLIIVWVFWGDKIVNIFKKSITPKPKRRTRRSTASKVVDITPEPAVNKTMQNYLKERASLMEGKNLATPVLVTLLLIVFIVICNPIAIVGVGERGVKVTLGQVSPKSYTEGVHLVTPFISKIKNMDVKTQKTYIETDLYTKDIQQAKISYVINYNLQPQNAHKMFREVGTGYVDNILMPVVEGTIKDVIGKWNAQDLVANRESATIDILKKLQTQLEPRYINVTGFQITDINYSGGFERAIESKVTAEQEALKAKNRTVQIQEEAKQKIISAEAEAKSMAIRANALTQNKALVEYEAVQKWDGHLPQYMMGNTVPFMNITAGMSKK
ncbi:MAG: prohibitin family protein [Brachyspira sp.]|nr:prohibitin family protein [Brachyspira sp.]